MTVNEELPLLTVHIQKTAGTSLRKLLDDVYGASRVYPCMEESIADSPQNALRRYTSVHDLMADPGLGQYRAYIGHFPYALKDLLPFPVCTATVLRDPVERTVSILDHLRRDSYFDKAKKELTLEELYDDPVINGVMVKNFQTRMLGLCSEQVIAAGAEAEVSIVGGVDHSDVKPRKAVGAVRRSLARSPYASPALFAHPDADDDMVARAQTAISDIDVVGVLDSIDVFISECSAKFGWNNTKLPRANANPKKVKVGWWFRRRIAKDNALDMELYKMARLR